MNIPLDEVIFFDAITSTPSTSAAVDGDSAPTFEVFEEGTDTDIGIGGTMTKRTSKTGNYRGTFTASAANGFEVGKWYSVIGTGIVGGVTAKAVLKNFRIVAAELVAGYPLGDLGKWLGGTIATPSVAGVPEVDLTHWLGTAPTALSDGSYVRVDVRAWLDNGVAATAPGVPNVNVITMATDAVSAGAVSAGAVTKVQTGLYKLVNGAWTVI